MSLRRQPKPWEMPGMDEGDDVVITFPSGRERTGRILHWFGGRADVVLDRDGGRHRLYREVHNYPKSWIKPWEA